MKAFEIPDVTVVRFGRTDVITTSCTCVDCPECPEGKNDCQCVDYWSSNDNSN